MKRFLVVTLLSVALTLNGCDPGTWARVGQIALQAFGYIQDAVQVMQVIKAAADSFSTQGNAAAMGDLRAQIQVTEEALIREARAARENRADLSSPAAIRAAFPDFLREFTILTQQILHIGIPFNQGGGASPRNATTDPPVPLLVERSR